MSLSDELAPFGVYVDEAFLDATECAALRDEMAGSRATPTPVYLPDAGGYVDADHIRSVRTVAVSPGTRATLGARFAALLPTLNAHFGSLGPLDSNEPLNFLRYVPGDHFEAHRDASEEAEARHAVRRVSIVLFVNDGAEDARPGGFVGGDLILCLFGDDPRAQLLGIPVRPRAGTLVAFPSTLVHQVTPVERGERFSIVTWAGATNA